MCVTEDSIRSLSSRWAEHSFSPVMQMMPLRLLNLQIRSHLELRSRVRLLQVWRLASGNGNLGSSNLKRTPVTLDRYRTRGEAIRVQLRTRIKLWGPRKPRGVSSPRCGALATRTPLIYLSCGLAPAHASSPHFTVL